MRIKKHCCVPPEIEPIDCDYCECKILCQRSEKEMKELKYKGHVEIFLTEEELIICGCPSNLLVDGEKAPEDAHNCDEMGCSSVSHVVFREKLKPVLKWREQEERPGEFQSIIFEVPIYANEERKRVVNTKFFIGFRAIKQPEQTELAYLNFIGNQQPVAFVWSEISRWCYLSEVLEEMI